MKNNKRIPNLWYQNILDDDSNKKDYHINEEKFRREYFGEFPRQTFLEWIEQFIIELDDVEEPNNIHHKDISEHFKRVGAYETQKLICEKLKYATNYERFRLERENKNVK